MFSDSTNEGFSMPVRTAIWKVGTRPEPLAESTLATEQQLEEMILVAPRLLAEDWMLMGRQVDTGLGGRVDLLAIAPDGALILIELKRNRTPRDVVAQALDYAGWVESLEPDALADVYARFAPGRSLAHDFLQRFSRELEEESLNQSHQIVIVAASLDDSTERIINYLSGRDIPINVLFFQVFTNGSEQLLSRTWLLDPVETPVPPPNSRGPQDPWNGEFYCNYGHSESRSWAEAVQYGFVCAGGGLTYSKPLRLLGNGDRLWVKAPGYGFVGVGHVTGGVQPAATFKINDVPVLETLKDGTYHREFINDPERCEYFVPVQWLQTVPLERAVKEVGLFGNPSTVCKPTAPRWRSTVERLKERFPDFNRG